MAYFTAGYTWSTGDQATSTRLNAMQTGLRIGADSVDGSTITVNAGVLALGVVGTSNFGATTIPFTAFQNQSIPNSALGLLSVGAANIQLLCITGGLIAEQTITFGKTATADRATQADMQSETAAHFVTPDVLKYHGGISKAWGILTMADGTIAGGSGISGSAAGTATTRTVTLSAAMANTNFRVQFSQIEVSGTTANAPTWTPLSTTTFSITTGAAKVAFDVLGQLA